MRKAVFLTVSAALFLLVGVAAYSADADHGKQVYADSKCRLCHSIAGMGNGKIPLDGVDEKLKPDEIKKWIKVPQEMKADMKRKAYPTMSDKDLEYLTACLLTLKK